MGALPGNLKYTKDHEWIRPEADGSVVVGITDHAQQQLGELVFVELPEPGRAVAAAQACAVVESVKAASDVYAPLAGTVIAANEALAAEPGLVNSSPYEQGWLFRLQTANAGLEGLLDAAAYQRLLDAEG
ncbi:MAG: glycine cleavage system H protein [Nevskiales bacterium]